jgi:hypothetical protein
MNTTVNVLGVQAREILKRIETTLDAVMRNGKENKQVQVMQEPYMDTSIRADKEEEPHLFTAQDPVFSEDRLTTEIPQANWPALEQVIYFRAWFDLGNKQPSIEGRNSRTRKNRPELRTKVLNKQLTVIAFPQGDRSLVKKQREVRSSLSPPI